MSKELQKSGLPGLIEVVDRLLGPGGCPWDQAQTHESLCKCLIEETYEFVDAVNSGDDSKLLEETGDLLLQPVMHAQMRAKNGGWDIDVVAETVRQKLVRRHPHVFGDAQAGTEEEVLVQWDRIKGEEKQGSVLDGVPRAMPALARAMTVSERAARQGFEWPDVEGVWSKLYEEIDEFKAAVDRGDGESSELGDLLFTVVNLARWHKIDAESALDAMVGRFAARFTAMEESAGKPLDELSPEEWDELWRRAKLAN